MRTRNQLFAAAGLILLGACGGASTSPSESQLVLASDSAGFAGTGLAFATEETGQVLDDLAPGDSFQIRVAGYENLQGESTVSPTLTTETVTIVDDGFGNIVAEITFRGETLSFSVIDGEINSIVTLASGEEIIVESPSGGTFSDVYEIYTYEDFNATPVAGGVNANANFVLGFETDPETVTALSGNATYNGIFGGFGGLYSRETDPGTGDITETVLNAVSVDGTVALTVDFDGGLVGAELAGGLDGAEETEFTASLVDAPIVGNSFQGDLAVTCVNGFTCSSNSEMGGAFYGPNADEAVGLIAFDVEGDDGDGSEIRYVSGAYFGAVD